MYLLIISHFFTFYNNFLKISHKEFTQRSQRYKDHEGKKEGGVVVVNNLSLIISR